MTGYHVKRLDVAGPITEHYDGPLETEGPWLHVWPIEGKVKGGMPLLLAPSHAVIAVKPCDGTCRVPPALRDPSCPPGDD